MGEHRHKRETDARRKPKALAVIGPMAFFATAVAVTVGVIASDPSGTDQTVLSAVDPASDTAGGDSNGVSAPLEITERDEIVSRSADRTKTPLTAANLAPGFMSKAAIRAAVDGVGQVRWTTDALNVWSRPGTTAKNIGELDDGKKVVATGRSIWGRTEIVLKGRSRWVSDGYLAEDKPAGAGAGLSTAPCTDGSVENGLTDGAVFVYRSVCHAFPQILTYGGWDSHGEHSSGRALDIMTSDVGLGTAIAEFLQAHASELDLFDVIWRQHIWTPVRAAEGWRSMSSRGSATADHYDHVHVAVY